MHSIANPKCRLPRVFRDRLAEWPEEAALREGPSGRVFEARRAQQCFRRRQSTISSGGTPRDVTETVGARFPGRGCQRPVRKGVDSGGAVVGDVFPRTQDAQPSMWTSLIFASTGQPHDRLRCARTSRDVAAPTWPSGLRRRL